MKESPTGTLKPELLHLTAEDYELAESVVRRSASEAAKRIAKAPADQAVRVLGLIPPALASDLLWRLPDEPRHAIARLAPEGRAEQWLKAAEYPEGSIGRLMEKPLGVFRPDTTIASATNELRDLVRRAFVYYGFVTDDDNRLVGVFAFRELLFARPEQTLDEIMIREPFSLTPQMPLLEAARAVTALHIPAYPVCDASGKLLGLVRGQTIFQQEALEISAQAGRQVGVSNEERVSTPWPRSFKFRHGWLQLNLLTAFVAAGVVAIFQDTIDRLVVLAMFLPVLAGQSGNTGCQALAVTLRALTLGELRPGQERKAVLKETLLGLLNGLFVGIVAGGGMVFVALQQGNPNAWMLGIVVALAMTGSCIVSGISGALIPLGLKRLGADPATASSIFLTTATDVASMGMLLGLATVLVR